MLVYGSGRPLTVADRPSVEAVAKSGRGLGEMIHAVVETEIFLRR